MRQCLPSARLVRISRRVYGTNGGKHEGERARPFVDEVCDLCWNASIAFRIPSGRMIFSPRQLENRISLENRRETSEASVARAKRLLHRDLCSESNNRKSCIFLNIWLQGNARNEVFVLQFIAIPDC